MDGWTREGREEEGSGNVQGSPVSTSPSPGRDSQQRRKDPERARHLKKTKHKTSSVKKKRRSKPDCGNLPEEGGEEAERRREQGGNWSVVRTFSEENRDGRPAGEGGGGEGGAAEEERPSVTGARGGEEPGEAWMRPLSSGELSSSSSDDGERERGGAPPCGRRGHSGMILKLRRVLLDVGRHRGGEERYRAVSAPERRRPLLSEAEEDGGRGAAGGGGGGERLSRRTAAAAAASSTPRTGQRAVSQRAVGRSHRSLRPVRPRTSLLKIRYCPYLSVCHSAEHRRVRWVLRSAVRRARRAMRMYYPDLVGKRVRHLYEETDKTEVWYRGLVVRVHEQHPNPLKTVFEVQYDSEPGWQYYLELLIDYKKGWLKIDD